MEKRRSPLSVKIAVAWFCLALAAPMIGQVFSGANSESALERRTLATFPDWQVIRTQPEDFPGAVNDWIEDHFGFRSVLIKIDFALRRTFEMEEGRRALRGDDGWLFNNVEKSLPMHQGFYPFAPGEAQAWLEGAGQIKEAACDAPFVVLLIPNKHTIYPEFLSAHPRMVDDPTRLEELEAAETDLAILSARKLMLALKHKEQVFFKTDTHWSPAGAYAAYSMLMDVYEMQGIAAPVIEEDRLDRERKISSTYDLYGLLGIERGEEENLPAYRVINPRRVEDETRLSLYDRPGFEARKIEMQGAHKPSLLIYGDSFIFTMKKYLQESFGEITLIHHHDGAPPLEPAETCGYDAVLLEMVERNLSHPLEPSPTQRPQQ